VPSEKVNHPASADMVHPLKLVDQEPFMGLDFKIPFSLNKVTQMAPINPPAGFGLKREKPVLVSEKKRRKQ